ncbi:Proteinase inhibitor I2, Kunitz metazoa domain and Cysteine-rich repeat-containing protein [Strongyloides ratti]|uniref:Proteinase inhibitor I2, Kunitz metazoa domain and Cysteine-rich repeat-containing protein n=1 Tax=Strongyloides ratti TaxID=34506 RepID=A0A090KZ12_STRRB|nr:Proteinase inhibitor I2, Kunitz metazoa domain and Cysteine-rich repeat-containing protein [Strongyloides ratti]CEF62730.1 Proteinase inhibitor I2, Kunitz metazoa domain and Cysteine-rich repeat-containing protein [Strongyloides ratti]
MFLWKKIILLFFVLCYNFCDGKPEKCTLAKNVGVTCENSSQGKKFYFDKNSGACQFFIYKGCQGNENNFDSIEECKNVCGEGKEDQTWVLAHKCDSNFLIPNGVYTTCKIGRSTCPENHTCSSSGVCCPNKSYVCTLEDDTGNFAVGVPDKPRFAWSDAINSCVRFSYYGANGNYNNFPNFQSCIKYCKNYKNEEDLEESETIRKM